MNISEVLDLVVKLTHAGVEIVKVVQTNVDQGKTALGADSLAELQAILEPLHAKNMEAGEALDEALAKAAG